jgi:hypothetical protein
VELAVEAIDGGQRPLRGSNGVNVKDRNATRRERDRVLAEGEVGFESKDRDKSHS